MKTILFAILMLGPCLTFGTGQFKEQIIYNGTTNILLSFPMDKDMVRDINYQTIVNSDGLTRRVMSGSTACHRGYIGTWEIKDDTLYLVRLQNARQTDVPADKLTDGASYPIKADWFTGELRIGIGRRRMNSSSTEVFLAMENGVISAEPEVIDREGEEEAFKTELATMKDSTDQLEHDLYEYLYHYNGTRGEYNFKLDALLTVASENLDKIQFPSCRTCNRSDEPSTSIRSYLRFLPTTEPRLYKVESIYKKFNNQRPIHYVGVFEDKAVSFSGQPDRLSFEKNDGLLRSIEKADTEALDTMVRFRNMLKGKTVIPNESTFGLSIVLSTNVLSPNDSLTVSVTTSNSGSEPISLCADDLDVEFLLENADGTNITESGPSDWIVRGTEMPMTLNPGESKPFGHIQPKVWDKSWRKNYDTISAYKGIILEVKDAIREAEYPLETFPGDYYISVQIRIRKDDNTELKFISQKQKIHIN